MLGLRSWCYEPRRDPVLEMPWDRQRVLGKRSDLSVHTRGREACPRDNQVRERQVSADEWNGITDGDRLIAAREICPSDYAVVPKEPTQAMLDEVCSSEGIEPWTDKIMADTYRAMIDAATR